SRGCGRSARVARPEHRACRRPPRPTDRGRDRERFQVGSLLGGGHLSVHADRRARRSDAAAHLRDRAPPTHEQPDDGAARDLRTRARRLPESGPAWPALRRKNSQPTRPSITLHLLVPSLPTGVPEAAARFQRVAMRMLFPDWAEAVDPAQVYADLPRENGRPSVRLNMIVSVDGGTSWNGVSGALGGPADKALFQVLRSLTDVVLVASGTMKAEHYGPAMLPQATQDARRQRGQTAVPPIAVVSRTCRFDWKAPFFTAATGRPTVITVSDADAADRARAAEVAEVIVAGAHDVDLA